MNLHDLIRASEIAHAHVIDDAYDIAPGAELKRASIETFLSKLDGSLFDKLTTLLNFSEGGEDEILTSLLTLEGAKTLYQNRSEYGEPADLLFEDFSAVEASERKRVDLLTQFLLDVGVKCHTFGRDYQPKDFPEPQILFVDLKLNEREVIIEQPIAVVNALRQVYPECNPLIFLMSSLRGVLSSKRDFFRDACNLFATQFEALNKSTLDDPDDLSLFLSHHIKVYPLLCQIQKHVFEWGNALDSAKDKLQKTLRSLDLPDYFVLYNNTISLEQVPLGTYVSDLLLEYVAHEIEASPGVSNFTKDLDALKLEELSRVRFNVAPVVSEVFSANVLHAFPRIAAETDRGRGPIDGYLNLGDIFFKNVELKASVVTTAYVVITPSCDLIRPDSLKKKKGTVLLCQGEVEVLKQSIILQETDGLHSVILRYPYDGGEQYVISWQKKRLQVWDSEDLDGLKAGDKGEYQHVGRLRPLYALQLQHVVTSDLSRIGVQRPPDAYVPHGVEVMIADKGKWRLILGAFRQEPSAGAVSYNKSAHQLTFMVSDVLIRATIRELRQRFKKSPEDAGLLRLNDAISFVGFDQLLMSCVHVFSGSEVDVSATTHSIFPLIGRLPDGTSSTITGSVAFALQDRGIDNQYVGGKDILAGNDAVLVFRFVKVSG